MKSDGVTVTGFSSGVLVYNIELAHGTIIVPTVTATATNAKTTITITHPASLPGCATAKVDPQDGESTTYRINFTLAS